MKSYWTRFSVYIEGRQLRERVLMFSTACGVLIMLLNTLLFDPLLAQHQSLHTTISQHQAMILKLTDQTNALVTAAREPTKNVDQVRLLALEQDLTRIKISLDELLQRQVSPGQMVSLLTDVLKHNQQLRLLAFKTLPVLPFMLEPANNTPVPNISLTAPLLYQHGVELTLEGSYGELLAYLDELENLPWQLFWGDLSFSVEEYPRERITVVLYTISTEHTWLSM